MSNHFHRCQWCEGLYLGVTLLVEGVDEDGRDRAACECKVTDECPGCSEHGACEKCGKAPAGDDRKMFLCTGCADEWEANYDGPEPDLNGTSLGEVMSAAYALDRSQK